MVSKDKYTQMLGSILSEIKDLEESTFRPMFLVGDNLILGKVIYSNDERLNKTELSKDGSVLFTTAANIMNIRDKHFNLNNGEDDKIEYEPVYLYLEEVKIHSISASKTIEIPEFALRISSIDGVSIGNMEQFQAE
ncbi:hypothetical protein FJO98_15725 [Enterococcus sp. PF-2]|jgi:hypothetical protein|uniref:hypothetical protein n=1 Tax=Enterococcus TaxID=1350 RepID=UPI00076B4925|nr:MULTISPECIES: hypothetical protein [Enterococcus]AMG50633.1 hypothetical protein AL523_13175 [Enterococcus gallinarum]TPE00281.1 hypothetical protein FJP08_16160 [Enterococcus sp. PF-3]TPE23617.1 hypothetical protein FJO98_15725 [Enterococcus sp. PF-2]STP35040.1 Uncharacterised protein [Enterococcus casseliflavus]GEB28422.1 hypothetical protein ECA02_15170 [Enterococcus casseliflavus]